MSIICAERPFLKIFALLKVQERLGMRPSSSSMQTIKFTRLWSSSSCTGEQGCWPSFQICRGPWTWSACCKTSQEMRSVFQRVKYAQQPSWVNPQCWLSAVARTYLGLTTHHQPITLTSKSPLRCTLPCTSQSTTPPRLTEDVGRARAQAFIDCNGIACR